MDAISAWERMVDEEQGKGGGRMVKGQERSEGRVREE